jgi:transcriptional regulator with XRE-family HTH domain
MGRVKHRPIAGADQFGKKFTLVLKALSISRRRVAADVEVDKSVVCRWASGAVMPSAQAFFVLPRPLVASIATVVNETGFRQFGAVARTST